MALRTPMRHRSMLNPVSRLALATFAWKHRHEILRWGRSLYEQLMQRRDLSPAHAARIGAVLYAITSDPRLRDAPELRRVTMHGDDVELHVDERWSELPHLVARVRGVRGVRSVAVHGVGAPGSRRGR